MRLLLVAMNCPKGELDANLAAHCELVGTAEPGDLVLFPELSLTGYVGPSSRPEALTTLEYPAITALVAHRADVGVCFGLAERIGQGDQAHITQVFAADGKVVGVQRKRHLGEDEDEFTPASRGAAVFDYGGVRIGIAICAEAGYDEPFDDAAAAGATLVLFPAAPGLYGRRTDEASWRAGHAWWEGSSLGDARRHARRLGLWIALAGQAGVTDDEDFPGLAALVSPDGEVVDRLPDWRAGVLTVELPVTGRGTGRDGFRVSPPLR